MSSIIRNIIKCVHCGDVLESVHTHDFKFCTCGRVAVDGGRSYLRRVGTPDQWLELSTFMEVVQ